MASRWWALVFGAALLGCGGDEDGAGAAGTPAPPKGVPPRITTKPPCVISADCPAGQHCDLGECVQQCNVDNACQSGTTCSGRARCVGSGQTDTDPPPVTEREGTIDVEPKRVLLTDRDTTLKLRLTSDSADAVRYRIQLSAPHLSIASERGEFKSTTELTFEVGKGALTGKDVPGLNPDFLDARKPRGRRADQGRHHRDVSGLPVVRRSRHRARQQPARARRRRAQRRRYRAGRSRAITAVPEDRERRDLRPRRLHAQRRRAVFIETGLARDFWRREQPFRPRGRARSSLSSGAGRSRHAARQLRGDDPRSVRAPGDAARKRLLRAQAVGSRACDHGADGPGDANDQCGRGPESDRSIHGLDRAGVLRRAANCGGALHGCRELREQSRSGLLRAAGARFTPKPPAAFWIRWGTSGNAANRT